MEALSFSRTLGLFFFFSCEEDAEDEDEELKPMVIQIEVTKKNIRSKRSADAYLAADIA